MLPLLFHAIYCEPVCIDLALFDAFHRVVWPRITGQAPVGAGLTEIFMQASGAPARPNTRPGLHGRATQAGSASNPDGSLDERTYFSAARLPSVAVVPLSGALAKMPSGFQEACQGITNIDRAAYAFAQAVADPAVKDIVLDVTSPGGQATGVAEFGNMVRAATQKRGKTVYAFTDHLMASAAYWIASQADEIYATPSSTIGSIGTYLAMLDETMRMQMQGVKLEFFSAGKFKGIGTPGRPLNQEDRAYLQQRVDQINGQFTGAVRGARPQVSDDAMQGQGFWGEEALSQGLIDGLVNDWTEFLELLS